MQMKKQSKVKRTTKVGALVAAVGQPMDVRLLMGCRVSLPEPVKVKSFIEGEMEVTSGTVVHCKDDLYTVVARGHALTYSGEVIVDNVIA